MTKSRVEHLTLIVPHSGLSQQIAAFVVDRQARGVSARTVEFYQNELKNFREFAEAQGISEVEAVQATLVRQYLLHVGTHRNSGGVHCAYRSLKTFLIWYAEEFEPEHWKNPIHKVKVQAPNDAPLEPVPLDDLKAMLDLCDGKTEMGSRDAAIIRTLFATGLRANELLSLTIADANLQTGSVIVRSGKGGKYRTVLLNPKARREITRYLRHRPKGSPGDPLFATDEGGRLTITGLRMMLHRRAEKAGVKTPAIHGFRRAFALNCLRKGMDLISLQRLLGHSDLSVIKRYLAQTETDLRVVYDRSGPDDGLL